MDNILEEKDTKFDAMHGQMVSRIKSKPEMGEVSLNQIGFYSFNIIEVDVEMSLRCMY